jgi:hypothetical protein
MFTNTCGNLSVIFLLLLYGTGTAYLSGKPEFIPDF